jgi:hypothetical protein
MAAMTRPCAAAGMDAALSAAPARPQAALVRCHSRVQQVIRL